jgi:tetratricopeptide (TPR) repeat protein
VALAAILASERDFAAALEQLDAALQIAPDQAEVHFLAGQILLQENKRDAALAKFHQALLLDEQNWRIRKQIWAIEHPDKFYAKGNPDYGWQRQKLSEERTPNTPAQP